MNKDKIADILTIGLMALVLLAMVIALLKSWKNDLAINEIEALSENTFEVYERLPEIEIKDPILPRALPPLIEGGEVYFEEMYYHEYPEEL